ncbi:MAG: arylsulfatase [Planctomycetes bacterium]|nr:arylsulfatase [Planctomycetota bacterium]
MRTPPSIVRAAAAVVAVYGVGAPPCRGQDAARPPNVVFILADDLGYGELGCYGQQKIRTPHLDRLAAEGLRFTQAYCGAPVCAPSRCVLMTGRHSGHAEIRGNREVKPEGQLPISAEVPTVPAMLHEVGYVNGAMGKWGLGPVGSAGDPNAKGFDLFYGYNCQREAHTYYPQHLWLNRERVPLDNPVVPGHGRIASPEEGYARFYGTEYAPDLMMARARGFLRARAADGRPFFLYLPFIEPHVAMQPPPRLVDSYPRDWDVEPYLGGRGYVPHPRPHAGYAAMITSLDEHVGSIVGLLDELGLAAGTLVVFSSDNGPTHDVGGVDTTFFASAGPLRGRKGSVYEGGIRVPMIARWPGRVAAGAVTGHVCAFQDVMPTLAELSGARVPDGCDGISFLPTLLGRPGEQRAHDHLTFEFHEYGGQKAVRIGRYKGVMVNIHRGGDRIELYDLDTDLGETRDVAAEHPDVVAQVRAIMATDRSVEPDFPMEAFDHRR